MADYLFYIFAALTVICGALVIINKNPINSAMFLVLSIASMAGLFVLLHAFFLAAVQVLVYAGAVMVLFLFVIMLLDLREEEQRTIKRVGGVIGLATVGVIYSFFIVALRPLNAAGAGAVAQVEGTTAELGR